MLAFRLKGHKDKVWKIKVFHGLFKSCVNDEFIAPSLKSVRLEEGLALEKVLSASISKM